MGYRGSDYYYRSRATSAEDYYNKVAEANYAELLKRYGEDFTRTYLNTHDVTQIDWEEAENLYRGSYDGIVVRKLDLEDDYDSRLNQYYGYEYSLDEDEAQPPPDITTVVPQDYIEGTTFWDILNKTFKLLSSEPIGGHIISEGVQGAIIDFINDLKTGDYASGMRKLNDVDNLVANMMTYLAARGVSKELLEKMQMGYVDKYGNFVPDYNLWYQYSYVLKNQFSDIIWEGYSSKYTGRYYDVKSGVFRTPEGTEYTLRSWSYAKGGNTKDMPQSGGWMKSKFGDYYIRKNLY